MRLYVVTMGAGAGALFLLGRALALTHGCVGLCDPVVSTTFGALAGLIAARMIRTA